MDTACLRTAPRTVSEGLDFLIGSWDVTGATFDGSAEPKGEVTGEECFTWSEDGSLLIHTWRHERVSCSAETVSAGYEFIDAEPGTARLRSLLFHSLGPFQDDGIPYYGRLDGERVVLTGPLRVTRTLAYDGAVTVESELPVSRDRWVTTEHCILTRLP
ncbi:MAG: hypothetical protein HOQ24_01250 [Mycobacteriaceae bacterium]|nr:hypothetical protein [Mycobacteriaceae bacterium]